MRTAVKTQQESIEVIILEKQATTTPDTGKTKPSRPRGSIALTQSQIERFLKNLARGDYSSETVNTYRQHLLSFYAFVPDGKYIDGATLPAWRDHLTGQGYTVGSVNTKIAAVNSFYNFIGKRNWQIVDKEYAEASEVPELSRAEYLRLLNRAKYQENIQLYLMIKILATTDLTPGDMPLVTREAVNEGVITGKRQGSDGPVVLSAPLQKELLNYAKVWGILSGPLFLNGNGKCHCRTVITGKITRLAEEIGLEPGKATPRNLRRMHLNTLAEFRKQADQWVADQYAALLAEEETEAGWWD